MKRRELLIHLLFWICLFLFHLVPVLSASSQGYKLQFFIRFLIIPLAFYANYTFLTPYLLLRKKVLWFIFSSIAVLVLINFAVNKISPLGLMIPNPTIQALIERKEFSSLPKMRHFMQGMLTVAFFLLGGTVALVKNLYFKEELSKAKEIKQKESEIQFLKAQLNPHFLFNSLNSIYSLVKDKSNDAPEAVISISEMMRYMLYEADKARVPVHKEIDYLKNFISLQTLRLVNHELVSFQAVGNYERHSIAPLLLISFVENAFKYGTDYKGNTEVGIHINIERGVLDFICRNRLIENRRPDSESSGIGLNNIRNRLELLYPGTHDLDFKKTEDHFIVHLRLQLD